MSWLSWVMKQSRTPFTSPQRTEHGMPYAVTCRAPGLSESWFYKWRDRKPAARQKRRAELTAKIREIHLRRVDTYGSPRVTLELRAADWQVRENTVAALMAQPGPGRPEPKRRRSPDQARQTPGGA